MGFTIPHPARGLTANHYRLARCGQEKNIYDLADAQTAARSLPDSSECRPSTMVRLKASGCIQQEGIFAPAYNAERKPDSSLL